MFIEIHNPQYQYDLYRHEWDLEFVLRVNTVKYNDALADEVRAVVKQISDNEYIVVDFAIHCIGEYLVEVVRAGFNENFVDLYCKAIGTGRQWLNIQGAEISVDTSDGPPVVNVATCTTSVVSHISVQEGIFRELTSLICKCDLDLEKDENNRKARIRREQLIQILGRCERAFGGDILLVTEDD